MSSGLLTMSDREIERVAIIKRIAERQLKQREGGKLLGLSSRQIIRLVKKYRRDGVSGLISVRRGKVSNRYKGDAFKAQIRQLVSQHYYDFGPTFAAATSKLLGLRFEPSETTAGYFRLMRQYIECNGRPLAVYSDKDSIFRINHPGVLEDEETQFGRAMRELGIKSICANSPQAKGRVERVNKTLQKRLVEVLSANPRNSGVSAQVCK